MIRIAISKEAYRALGGSDDPPPRQALWQYGRNGDEYYLWLTPDVAAHLSAARAPGESHSDTILRMSGQEIAK